MGRKCSVADCLSESNRHEDTGVTFHKIPMHSDIRPKWMSLCRIPEGRQTMKVTYICSRHFLRADFCNFKGTKYMLKQGVLPSVFPWNKMKLESQSKCNINKEVCDDFEEKIVPVIEKNVVGKEEDSRKQMKLEIGECSGLSDVKFPVKSEMKNTVLESLTLKEDSISGPSHSTTIEQKVKTIQTPTGTLNFALNSRIEALDFNQMWYPARVVEVDYEESEVLIHFEKYSSKYDEWICMNSSRLRPLQVVIKKSVSPENYEVGERCLASWSDSRKFPATVTKVINSDTYEVLFDDGFVKVLKVHRMAKTQGKPIQASPLFDPVSSSKQERRDKKRKINIAALFGKRPRTEVNEDQAQLTKEVPYSEKVESPVEEFESWIPTWENGRPIGTDSVIEAHDGPRKSVIVSDPRIPLKWQKHLTQRAYGASAGKWDTVIVSPEGRKFRTRSEIKVYIEDHPGLKLSEAMFDFSLHRRPRKLDPVHRLSQPSEQPPQPQQPPQPSVNEPSNVESGNEDDENTNSLKIPVVDNTYKCPIEGCGKNFRKENLAQMHVKHYHPEYTKYLDSTPNVADLAYARTVGESLDRSPGPERSSRASGVRYKAATPKNTTPKSQQPPGVDIEPKVQQTLPSKLKDSEIIKLLNSKPGGGFSPKEDEPSTLPPGLPSNMYPDIKLKDLLNKSEGIPKRDDLNLKSLSAGTLRPTGIKTLLPVIRAVEPKEEISSEEVKHSLEPENRQVQIKQNVKRKRVVSDNNEDLKFKEAMEVPTTNDQGNTIIEGGEVIKIVHMRREEIINCTCGITEEDGLMIQCELCLCWQHAYCNNIERENQVPEKYICYICQNPARQRSSKKHYHDQDWLKHGNLATASYHCKDNELLNKTSEKLKKLHSLSGALVELKDYAHTMRVKIKIAEAKNHTKSYLWSKPWEKPPLPETLEKEESEVKLKLESETKNELETKNESMLLSILKSGRSEKKVKDEITELHKIDISTMIENNLEEIPVSVPVAPQPAAAIDSADCRLNLLEHIGHSQSLVEERLIDFEDQVGILESEIQQNEADESYPRTRQTINMMLRDLSKLQEFGQLNTL